jgi:amidohydrolase
MGDDHERPTTGLSHAQPALEAADKWLSGHADELVAWRRDLHAHPEVGHAEFRTTTTIEALLSSFGLKPRRLKVGTGVLCDIGSAGDIGSGSESGSGTGRDSGSPKVVALRADIDALPLPDHKTVPYASRTAGVCHACGHDAHTAILLGVAAALARLPELPGAVRLIFQPAEERMPGGAVAAVNEGALDNVSQIFALHCDPKLDAGLIGVRSGPITAAFDQIEVRLTGPGGHTARPHLTADLVYALGSVITELPGLLSRRVDPRSALSLVWGAVSAGSAANAIPTTGVLRGTLRMLDGAVWHDLETIVSELVRQIVAPTGAAVSIGYERGLPAVMNDGALVGVQTQAAIAALGPGAVTDTPQSMGGEDFAWYLQSVPGAMARLGVRRPDSVGGDLHQSDFDIDEDALAVGVRFTASILDVLWANDTSGRDGNATPRN